MAASGGAGNRFTKEERDDLIARHRDARGAYNRAMDEHAVQLGFPAEIGVEQSNRAYLETAALRLARTAHADLVAIGHEYFRRLPRLPMGPCPYCDRPLVRSFDSFAFDGLWWRSDAQPDEPVACPHFCLLQGAVDLGPSRPAPDFDVHLGPGAPFVVPRLLALDGMVAVISEIAVDTGARVFPIAYFAPRRPPVQQLGASWARTNFVYSTQLGVHAWRSFDEPAPGASVDSWDFSLDPWLVSQKVRWCDPGSDRNSLSSAPASACPFAKLSGVTAPQVILAVNARSA
ncbi:MAG: Uncharacterized protein JWM82_2129 [Myxococcales bacterium]|nr:Uncharacterized protein [Myxococcales bacterium]